ncbi:MAG TPA: anti-sigma regulatory factor [Planctomycetaceae bacterium]|nr:anti-sigma regulatory factor [Planctomycetaceae bacterium]HIQ22831.1 anti-sigma regulatory factor [Planctomycetota bacterium]
MAVSAIPLKTPADVVAARELARRMACELGFGLADQTRLATAVSEVARNAIQYAGGGMCTVLGQTGPDERVVVVRVEDDGPGIHNLEEILKMPSLSGRKLGSGLEIARRLVHDFQVHSEPGRTNIALMMRRRIV